MDVGADVGGQLTRLNLTDQLTEIYAEAIESGRFPPGAKLPTEEALMTTHRVSQKTVRRALAQLKDRGLVYSQQGKGVFVTTPPQLPIIIEGETDPWANLTVVKELPHTRGNANPDIAGLMDLPYKDLIFLAHQITTGTRTGQPVLVTRIIPSVSLEILKPMPSERTPTPDLVTKWTDKFGPLEIHHYDRAVIPTPDKWHDLGITKPTPAMETIVVTSAPERGTALMAQLFLTAANIRHHHTIMAR